MTYRSLQLNADCTIWVALDPEDWDWAQKFVWNYKPEWTMLTQHFYAKRNVGRARTPVYLHRKITERAFGPPPLDKPISDHKNGNTLDCRRQNLHWASHKTNRHNRKMHRSFCLPFQGIQFEGVPF